MTDQDPKRYRKDVELHQAWRMGRISPTFANEIYDRIAELEAIVEKLPKTADGVAVVPEETVWFRGMGLTVRWHHSLQRWAGVQGSWCPDISSCYSTREAAEAAKAL